MERDQLRRLLEKVSRGKLGVVEALEQMRHAPIDDLCYAQVDLNRAVRRGFPEVIFGQGKTPEQVRGIADRLAEAGQSVLVTRVDRPVFEALVEGHPRAEFHEEARAVVIRQGRRRKGRPGVTVFSAGTADQPVAEEAAVTAEALGNQVERIYDVGVAGLHRLLRRRKVLDGTRVAIVVAGMDGALPAVVAGLGDCPVIGVPTSAGGYGAGGQGPAALLTMLNACASGVTVVNIDNGFGAGYAAAMINRGPGRGSRALTTPTMARKRKSASGRAKTPR